jgi:hypothetical protein
LIWAVAVGVGPILGGVFESPFLWDVGFLLLFFLDAHNPPCTPIVTEIKAVDWFGTISILGQ